MIENFEKPMNYMQYFKNLIPSALTMIFLSFYTTIDGFFVSRYAGSDALAGINIVIPVTCVTFGVAVMLATGAGAVIGEKLGQKEDDKANEIFSFICIVLLLFSVLFTLAGVLFIEEIAVFLGSNEALMKHVVPYGLIVFIGTVPMAFKLFFEYLVRNDGNPKIGLIMSVAGLILNVLLDYVFVGVYDMGTFGAAWGTTLSITVSALIGFVYFLKFGHIKFGKPKASGKILLKSCTNGFSEMLTEFSTGITTFLFNIIIMSYFGEDGVAAVTIIMYIYYFFIAFYMGVAVATAPIVSYNLGAENYKKIRETLRHSFITIAVSSMVIVAVSYLCGKGIIGIFSEPGRVFDITWDGLKLFALVFICIGVNVFLSGYFTALGNGLISAVISSLRSLLLVVAFILLLPKLMGVEGVWLTMPLAEAVTVIVSLCLFFKWGRTAVIEKRRTL